MFYFAKICEAAGLGVIAINFFASFPKLMNMQVFFLGVLIFACGWFVERMR